jgi:hypothetical protein
MDQLRARSWMGGLAAACSCAILLYAAADLGLWLALAALGVLLALWIALAVQGLLEPDAPDEFAPEPPASRED